MLLKKSLAVFLVATTAVQAHAPVAHGQHHILAARDFASDAEHQIYARGLLDGLLGVVGSLTGQLGGLLDPQKTVLGGLVGALTGGVTNILNALSDLPKLELPIFLGNTTGIIELSGPTGGYLGLAQTYNGISATYGVVKNKKDAVIVTIPAISCLTLPNVFAIYAPLVGSSQPVGTPFLSINSFKNTDGFNLTPQGGVGFLLGSNLTASNTFATGASPYQATGGESTVWSMKCSTRELSATWTTPSRQHLPLAIMHYVPSFGFLEVTSNIADFNAKYSLPPTLNPTGQPVKLTFTPTNENDLLTFGIL